MLALVLLALIAAYAVLLALFTLARRPDVKARLASAFRSGGRLPLPALTATLFLASLLVTECGVYCENHAVQVPLVRLLNDPGLYPGDPLAASLRLYPS